jgi:hypothetical protein
MWTGSRRIAFIPASNEQVDGVLPDDFQDEVYRRVYFDPDPQTGVDRSLQAYIHHTSSGRAYITGEVFPPVVVPDADVIRPALESLPHLSFGGIDIPTHGYEYAVVVLPHTNGPHRGGYAWWNNSEINGIANRARVALYTDQSFGQRYRIGAWAMETLHVVTELGDLYNVSPNLGEFDPMAYGDTHPSAHTKSLFGWLGPGAVRTHPLGNAVSYNLHAVSYPQPPPPGRATAVSIRSGLFSASRYMVEARLRTDPYETAGVLSSGIPEAGVLVYEVRSPTAVFLRKSGLVPGQTFRNDAGLLFEIEITVTGEISGGYAVTVNSDISIFAARLEDERRDLQSALERESDPQARTTLMTQLSELDERRVALGSVDVQEAEGRHIPVQKTRAARRQDGETPSTP